MERKIIALFTVALLGLTAILTGCGGKGAPGWFLEQPDDSEFLYANATATSAGDIGMALTAAKQEGMRDIAGQIGTKVNGMFKRFTEEIGAGEDVELMAQTTAASESVVSEVVRGCKPVKQEVKKEGDSYRAYVRMKMPAKMMDSAVVDKVKSDKNMYTRFRSSQAFKELEDRVSE